MKGYMHTSPDVRSMSSHQAPSNVGMVNKRSGILVKEICMFLYKSSCECICKGERWLQLKKAFIHC